MRLNWILVVWRFLCLLAVMSALTAVTVWESLPPAWQGLLVAPGLLVALLIVIASVHDSVSSSRRAVK